MGLQTYAPVTHHRLYALDGLRGWAAFVVLLYHVWVEGFPVSDYSAALLRHIVLFNGNIAVYIFFVISGFVLSIGYFKKMDANEPIRLLAGRYARLVIPVFVASVLFYLSLQAGWVPHPNQRPAAFSSVLLEIPPLLSFLEFHAVSVFIRFDMKRTMLFALWTMQYEFLGSIALLCTFCITHRLPHKALNLLIAGVGLGLMHRLYGLMFIGALLALLFARKSVVVETNKATAAAIAVALFLCGAMIDFGEIPSMMTAVAIVVSVISLSEFNKCFASPISKWLGTISFPLYLVHGAVLWLVGLNLYGHANQAFVNCLIVIVAVGVSCLFVPIERMAIQVARYVGRIVAPVQTSPK